MTLYAVWQQSSAHIQAVWCVCVCVCGGGEWQHLPSLSLISLLFHISSLSLSSQSVSSRGLFSNQGKSSNVHKHTHIGTLGGKTEDTHQAKKHFTYKPQCFQTSLSVFPSVSLFLPVSVYSSSGECFECVIAVTLKQRCL